jgi:hypothetical protein
MAIGVALQPRAAQAAGFVGRGHASLLTNSDTWHCEPFTDTWYLLDTETQAVGRGARAAHLQHVGGLGLRGAEQDLLGRARA